MEEDILPKAKIIFTSVFILFGTLFGDIFHVPAHYPSIQEAIYSASEEDTVLVDTGIYQENLRIDKSTEG